MRRAVYVTAILVLLFLVEPIALVSIVNANPYPQTDIRIWSPEQFKEKTYQTSTIPIEVQIDTPAEYPKITRIYYIIDLNYSSSYNPQKQLSISNPQSNLYYGTGTLEHLTNGTHTLDVYAVDAQGKTIKSGTRNFLVNATSTYPTPNNEQPFTVSNITIVLVIAIIAVIMGTVTAVVLFKRKMKKLASKQVQLSIHCNCVTSSKHCFGCN